ncbi:hypothetical protein C0U40_13580 [Amylibacter cionae]|nr:hypothetical protein C0U40_13580 [Amylibacter cionae]
MQHESIEGFFRSFKSVTFCEIPAYILSVYLDTGQFGGNRYYSDPIVCTCRQIKILQNLVNTGSSAFVDRPETQPSLLLIKVNFEELFSENGLMKHLLVFLLKYGRGY